MRGDKSPLLVRIVGQTTRSDNLKILVGCFVMAGDTAGLDDFADRVVPELQRREPFRKECAATTLREHLGLNP